MQNVLKSPKLFLDKIFNWLTEEGIDVANYELDHICYRVSSMKRYQEICDIMSIHGQLLSETIINDRPISSFRLEEAIIYGDRKISVFEIPSPKPGSLYEEGYEHVEFVIPHKLESFMDMYPDIQFDTSGIFKKVNADIRIKGQGFSVKFHNQSLEYVIKYLD